ncbi:P-loop containing nucleoside triphosphate hydrolase protein [Pyrenochaeta sp. MPI-SDFR-AT-0127]|nr:P-loop containing nucleoside triphosphate hydrolase protein [Pyrenochaeta sp. MPI-SDFR-AT-0127]
MDNEQIVISPLIDRPNAPRPWLPDGTWACYLCKSKTLQFSTEPRCRSCGKDRDGRSPSSQNGFERKPFDRYRTLLTSLNLNALVTPDGSVLRRKILLLGDPLCGKTYLASTWSEDKTPEPDASILNNFIKKTVIEGHQMELVIWDTTGSDTSGHERMRRLSYDDVHVVLICFDIAYPDSFENIEHLWNIEADNFLHDVPKILVGCKKDLRNDKATLNGMRQQQIMPVSPYAADKLAVKIQALAYFETSAVDRSGLNELFDYVAEAALKQSKTKVSGLRRFLSRSEMKFKP